MRLGADRHVARGVARKYSGFVEAVDLKNERNESGAE